MPDHATRLRATREALPAFLRDLVGDGTPGGIRKLLAAWDGLAVETQIAIAGRAPRDKALSSPNAYLRYLEARNFMRGLTLREGPLSPEDEALKAAIESDPDPLVASCGAECLYSGLVGRAEEVGGLFQLRHEERLAAVRGMRPNHAYEFSWTVVAACETMLPSGAVTETEVFEVVAEFVGGPQLREYFEDSHRDGTEDLDALWMLVPKVPASVAHLLVSCLPVGSGGSCEKGRAYTSPALGEVLDGLPTDLVEVLLRRRDVRLEERRKKVFWDSLAAEEPDEALLGAALSHHFRLNDDEFGRVLADERKRGLERLAWYATDLDLVHDQVLADMRFEHSEARERLERKLRSDDEHELRRLRVYRLAKHPARIDPRLGYLKPLVKPGDAWGTFRAFLAECSARLESAALERYLPRIEELGEQWEDREPRLWDDTTEVATKMLSFAKNQIRRGGAASPPGDSDASSRLEAAAQIRSMAEALTLIGEATHLQLNAVRMEAAETRATMERRFGVLFLLFSGVLGLALASLLRAC